MKCGKQKLEGSRYHFQKYGHGAIILCLVSLPWVFLKLLALILKLMPIVTSKYEMNFFAKFNYSFRTSRKSSYDLFALKNLEFLFNDALTSVSRGKT